MKKEETQSKMIYGSYELKERFGKVVRNYLCMASEKDAPLNETFEEKQKRIKSIAEKVDKLIGL